MCWPTDVLTASPRFLVALNNHPTDAKIIDIPVWQLGVGDGASMDCLLETTAGGYGLNTGSSQVCGGMLHMELPAESGFILVHRS